ncbi:putative S-transferase [Streptococcus pneumoniae]|nr:putative S-transferase [Streptococcus pneumoniae]
MNWLFWQAGAAPFLGGGFGHFFNYAPDHGQLVQGNLYQGSAKFLDASSYQNLVKWAEKIANRPAVKRGLEVTYTEIK